METKKISIIVPIYKVEQFIDKCIDSIVNQSYNNLEKYLLTMAHQTDALKYVMNGQKKTAE